MNLRNFEIDLRKVSVRFWRLLGEAKSKCQHLDETPLLPVFRESMLQMTLIRGVQATTAIEGNTLTVDEVKAIYENRSEIPKSRQYLEQEVRNVLEVFNAAVRADRPESRHLTIEKLKEWNGAILKDLEVPAHVTPGEFRTETVRAGNYVCPPGDEIPELMRHFNQWYEEAFRETPAGFDPIEAAIVKAIAAHVYFVMIHPFGDGNGRTARLIEWFTLDCAGISTTATHLLSNHYNLTRNVYYRMLDEASLGGDLVPFLTYAVEGLVDQLAEQLNTIYYQHATLVFAETVRHSSLGKSHGTTERRRELAVAMAIHQRPVPTEGVRILSAELAEHYRTATSKTIMRDLHALQGAGLIEYTPEGWQPQLSSLYWRHRRAPAA